MDPSPYGPEPPKESLTKRFKLVWRVLLISNLALGAYMFAKARKRDMGAVDKKGLKTSKVGDEGVKTGQVDDDKGAKTDKEVSVEIPEPSTPSEFAPVAEEPMVRAVATQPVKVARAPILEDQQRELFRWMLEEKRKIKPKDTEEKKRIDEEKAILKHFIRAERIPKLLTVDSFDSSLRDWEKYFSE